MIDHVPASKSSNSTRCTLSRTAPRSGSGLSGLGLVLGVLGSLLGCATGEPLPSAADFVAQADQTFLERVNETQRAQWIQQTYITQDSEAIAAEAYSQQIGAMVELAKGAANYDAQAEEATVARKLGILKGALTLPAPGDDAKREELTEIAARMESTYGSGEFCRDGGECLTLGELEDVIDRSRSPEGLLEAWDGWRTISRPMRADYERFVEIANEGAQELGFSDVGAMWRSKYDMPADEFAGELDRLWGQVKPLYDQLQCHVRGRLEEQYGAAVVGEDGTLPAHLLGNMWAQSWSNVYDLVAPPASDPGYDLTEVLQSREIEPEEMVRVAEGFFTSLGLDPLPETFWERSQFVKPRDRDVVCHASAWQVDFDEDVRIKMCIDVNAEDFSTIHHELGHSFYQLAYREQDPLFRDSANDGFHEALGDTIALSVTPRYLVDLGFIEREPPASADLGLLMRMALDKVAFLPFGLLVDQWRWGVFSGDIPPAEYNSAWWSLRERYQGVSAPNERTEEDFDPGAKYHVPANTPYTRYFLAHILQFQIHRDLCAQTGYEGPLHRCSIYANEEAGARLGEMMEMGLSRPWPEALAALGGDSEMDATAVLDYFAPLQAWLEEENASRSCGWS